VSFASKILCVATQRVLSSVVYFVSDSVRETFGYTLVFTATNLLKVHIFIIVFPYENEKH